MNIHVTSLACLPSPSSAFDMILGLSCLVWVWALTHCCCYCSTRLRSDCIVVFTQAPTTIFTIMVLPLVRFLP